jgi:hypothetical protein
LTDLEALGERLERRLQSLTDKQENRIKKEVDEKLEMAAAYFAQLGQPMPAEVRQQVINDTILSRLGDSKQAASPEPSPEDIRYANNMRKRLERTLGVQLTESDPEWREVRWEARTPDEHVDSYEEALKKKAARLQPQSTAPGAPPQPARAPMVGNAPAAGGDKITQLQAQYNAEKANTPSGEQMLQLRRKYRALGLPL